MSSFSIIQQKLEQFIKKYYTSALIKGVILFFAIGLLYFLITLLVEHFLWLSPLGRTILFWSFVAVEFGLFVRFIAIPLAKLFKLQKGINHEEASKIIGQHFPNVNDKLLNVIQLNQNTRESELLAASIDQKASQLEPIPFKRAINYKRNAKYLKYAAIPIIIFLLFTALGDKNMFSSSYDRVVNYQTAYEPPAPFSFQVLNDGLTAIENKPFTVKIKTNGETVPENASIAYHDEVYYLQQGTPGVFEYTFTQPTQDFNFRLIANKVTSRPYQVKVVKTPTLKNFEMVLDYPGYTGKKDEIFNSTGNAIVPEGTRVTWNVVTQNTERVALKIKDTVYNFSINQNSNSKSSMPSEAFQYRKGIYSKLDYAITTSNTALKDYENLSFTLGVVKDEYPEIKLQSRKDSVDSQKMYFLGNISDDYGLTKLQLVYYKQGEEAKKNFQELSVKQANFDQFTYNFPGNLPLEQGVPYEYYFEIFDNDAIHRFKATKTSVFNFRKLTKEEQEDQQLEQQENTIEGLSKTLEELEKQDKRLEELSKTQKEKKELNYNDKKKLEDFIKRQKQQEEMMKNFNKELKENLEEFQKEKEDDPFKEQLKERLKESEEKLKENEKLLEELEKLQEKIQKEELTEKLEKLSKQNKNQEKNLEQLLELTKRYYVTKKAEKLAEEIYKLGEEQEKQADKPQEENTPEKQKELNEKFEEYQKEMEELQKENEELKKPMEIPQEKEAEKEVEKEQQKATDNLSQQKQKEAKESQKKAGKKMKKMGKAMQAQMEGAAMEAIEEDVDMLRQILDNLVVFSFEQEDLMETFKETDYGSPIFGKKLNIQNNLKLNFEHIDDSLFALSLRQPMISEEINESLTEVSFNIDKSLERLAENQMRQGISSQQYTVTGANELAILLSDMLNNMQNQMMMMGSGKGKGQGKGFQLPDIIEKQESLSEKMKEGTKKGKGKKPGEGEEGQGKGQGEGEGEGKGKGDGEKQGEGEGNGDGDGENGRDGKGGKDGNNGEGKGEGESEDNIGELYEIYKQQQQLRQQLEDKLSKEGLKGKGGDILKKMEGIEQQLLDKGFNERTLEQMLNLKYELLKLDKADFQQGQEEKRESQTSKKQFVNNLQLSPEEAKKYFNSTEILNRDALPLKQNYKQKVNTYFKQIND